MKTNKLFLIGLTTMILILAGVVPASADAPRETFTVVDTQTQALGPGVWVFHDGHVQITGMVNESETCWTFLADSETICHKAIVTLNGIFLLPEIIGPMWGSFEFLDENDNLTWEGTFVGTKSFDNGDIITTVTNFGRGTGTNQGLLFQFTLHGVNVSPENQVPLIGTGYIQTTGKTNP